MKKNNYCTLYIVRHGETVWNVQKLLQGQKDSRLTEKGIEQAQDLAKKFKTMSFDAIFSSDLLRAKRTAEILAVEHNLAIQTNKLLRERHFGRLEGTKISDLDNGSDKLFEKFQTLSSKERSRFRFANEENDEEIVSRFITFLREVSVTHAGKRILVVSHGGIMRVFLIHVGFATYEQLPHGAIDNTAYIKLESDGVDFFVRETVGIHKKEV